MNDPAPRVRIDRAWACWLGGMLVTRGVSSTSRNVAAGMMLISAMAAVCRVVVTCGPGVHRIIAPSTKARARARAGADNVVARNA